MVGRSGERVFRNKVNPEFETGRYGSFQMFACPGWDREQVTPTLRSAPMVWFQQVILRYRPPIACTPRWPLNALPHSNIMIIQQETSPPVSLQRSCCRWTGNPSNCIILMSLVCTQDGAGRLQQAPTWTIPQVAPRTCPFEAVRP